MILAYSAKKKGTCGGDAVDCLFLFKEFQECLKVCDAYIYIYIFLLKEGAC